MVKHQGNFYQLVEKPYYINLVGIRNQYEGQKYSNKFMDRMWAIWKDDAGKWQSQNWSISSIPGAKHGKQTMKQWCKTNRPQGLGILVPAQYLNIYSMREASGTGYSMKASPYFSTNAGQYTYRDQNFDSDIITFSNKKTAANKLVSAGMFIHRGFPSGVNVNNWSEGCQVFSKESDYKQLIALARYHIKKHGNKFNYTLLEGREVA